MTGTKQSNNQQVNQPAAPVPKPPQQQQQQQQQQQNDSDSESEGGVAAKVVLGGVTGTLVGTAVGFAVGRNGAVGVTQADLTTLNAAVAEVERFYKLQTEALKLATDPPSGVGAPLVDLPVVKDNDKFEPFSKVVADYRNANWMDANGKGYSQPQDEEAMKGLKNAIKNLNEKASDAVKKETKGKEEQSKAEKEEQI